MGFCLGRYRVWFKLLKSDNVIHNINSVKKKSNMIYQLIQEKPLATFKIHLPKKKKIKQTNKKPLIILSIEKNFLNLRDIYKTLTTNIILNGKTMNIFPLREGINQRCPLSTPPIQHPARSAHW